MLRFSLTQSLIRHVLRSNICWSCFIRKHRVTKAVLGSLPSRGEIQHVHLLLLHGRGWKALPVNIGLKSEFNLIIIFHPSQLLHMLILPFAQQQNPVLLHGAHTTVLRTHRSQFSSPSEIVNFRHLAVWDIKGTYIVRQKRAITHHRLTRRPAVRWSPQS